MRFRIRITFLEVLPASVRRESERLSILIFSRDSQFGGTTDTHIQKLGIINVFVFDRES